MTAETKHRELIAFLTNQISQLTSFADMFDFYLLIDNERTPCDISAARGSYHMTAKKYCVSVSGLSFIPFAIHHFMVSTKLDTM